MAEQGTMFKSIKDFKKFLSGEDDIAVFRDTTSDRRVSNSDKRIATYSTPTDESMNPTISDGPIKIGLNLITKDKKYADTKFSNMPVVAIREGDGSRRKSPSGAAHVKALHSPSGLVDGVSFLDALVAEFEVLADRETEGKISDKEQELLGAYRTFLLERTGMNEGGAVMDKQMEMAFAEGGALDLDTVPDNTQGVDPVSGNEVPLGSMPEEVRDDIPAQLSEGEYVVPADVVRFFGVKFFEDIRNEAKQGFAAMEANGRIGGEPMGMEMGDDELPFDISELQMVDDGAEEQPMMNMGGYMRGYADGGLTTPSAVTEMTEATGIPMPAANLSGIEMKEYVGPGGLVMYIQFINGVAQSVIPEGYTAKPAQPTAPAAPAGLGIVSPPEDNNNTAHEDMMREAQKRESIDWSSPDTGIEQYEKTLEQNNSLLAKGFSGLATVLGGPIVAGFMAVAKRHQNNKMLEGATARLEDPNVKGAERDKWVSIHNRLSGLDEDGKASNSFTEGLANLLTPDDGMEYVNGVLVDTKTGKVLKPGIANSKGNDVVAPTPTAKPKPKGGGDADDGPYVAPVNTNAKSVSEITTGQKDTDVTIKNRKDSSGKTAGQTGYKSALKEKKELESTYGYGLNKGGLMKKK